MTREEWLAARAAEQHITVEQLLAWLAQHHFVILECDGSCDYDRCEGWIVRLDIAELLTGVGLLTGRHPTAH